MASLNRHASGAMVAVALLAILTQVRAEAPDSLVGPFPATAPGQAPALDVDSLSQLPPPPPPPPELVEKHYCNSRISATQAQVVAFNWSYGQSPGMLLERKQALDEATKRGDKSPQLPPVVHATASVTPPIHYPAETIRHGAAGSVVLLIAVSSQGRSVSALVACSDEDLLSKSALQTVSEFRFVPATMHGNPVPDIVKVPMHFQMQGRFH